jgi:putative DNA primase/helicase
MTADDKDARGAPREKKAGGDAPADETNTPSNITPGAAQDNGHVAGVLPHHLGELRASGLSDETIRAAGIRSETNYQRLAALLGWRRMPKKMAPAIVFPFSDANGSNGYTRIKCDTPRKLGGKTVKYESPRGRANEVYLPPGVAALLDNPSAELLISEGEKKSLKATQDGFPCIGLVGVYGWKDGQSERLLTALERVAWQGRPVWLVFDSDGAENPNVRDAEARLAKHLSDRGAVVRVVRLPAGPPGADGKPAKFGLDDFLVAQGRAELRKLLDIAEEPEPVGAVEMRAKASELDPATEAAAMLAADTCDGLPRLRNWRGMWLKRKGASYVEVSQNEVRARVIRALNRQYRKLSQRITGDVMDQLKAQAVLWGDIEPPAWIGKAPVEWPADEVLATQNALVHLPTLVNGAAGCLLPPTPRFFTTAALSYDFLPDAPRPDRWLAFLAQLWPDDTASIDALQEWVGYFLTLDTSLQKMLTLIGPRRSGKGTIARVVRQLIGPQNVAGPALAAFAQNFGLWPLIGKPLAVIHDARLGNRSDQAVIVERLLSITGEDAITIDRKFLEPWTGKLPTRLMILTNELPRLHDSSGALVGRMILLRLHESFFGRENPQLTNELLVELPGILLWAVEGWRRLRERGHFEQPLSGAELLSDLRDLTSPIGAFLNDCCCIGPGYRVSVQGLYAEWRNWCAAHGRREPGTDGSFGRDLLAAVPTIRKRQQRFAGGRESVYEGIGLLAVSADGSSDMAM